MKEETWSLPGGSLSYRIKEEKGRRAASVTGLSGPVSSLTVPPRLGDCPVTEISRKAFLSRKTLREVVLPATLERAEDWAFAYCSRLERVVLPAREITFGRSVFLECGALREIAVKEMSDGLSGNPERWAVPELTAAAVVSFGAYYLLDPVHAGNREWLAKWDSCLLSYLHTQDQEGFAKQVLCGEEDYGSTDLEAYLKERRKSKVRLAFLRLLNPGGLKESVREELEKYLVSHTKGCLSEETWEVVLQEHGEERRYFELFTQLGCLTDVNFDGILTQIGEDCPEMKAYFLRIKQERIGYADFFEGLSLEL